MFTTTQARTHCYQGAVYYSEVSHRICDNLGDHMLIVAEGGGGPLDAMASPGFCIYIG